jgi:hypothetical protein
LDRYLFASAVVLFQSRVLSQALKLNIKTKLHVNTSQQPA